MKARGVLMIIAFVLTGMGMVLMVFTATGELNETVTLTLPEGEGTYTSVTIDMKGGGPINGSFETESGLPVWFSLMDEGQYEEFASGTGSDARYDTIDSEGGFDVEQVDMEICYFVARHAGDSASAETVNVNYSLQVLDLQMLILSVALFVSGAGAFMYSVYAKMKETKGKELQLSKYDDVVFFDEEK